MFDDEVPDTSLLSPDGCCICGASPVEIGLFGYPWCEQCSMRRFVLEWGSEQEYPALRYANDKVAYTCGQGLFHWLTTALCGSDDYVWSILLVIDQYTYDHLAAHG